MNICVISGSYRKNGVGNRVVDHVVKPALEKGAQIHRINLIEQNIKYCTNCRMCVQEEGETRGRCVLEDDMPFILDELEKADAVIFVSPVNFSTITAVMKTFVERLLCYAYWPWGAMSPEIRTKKTTKVSAFILTSAAPGFLTRFDVSIKGLFNRVSELLGAKPVDILYIGLVAKRKNQEPGFMARKKAKKLGKKIVSEIKKMKS